MRKHALIITVSNCYKALDSEFLVLDLETNFSWVDACNLSAVEWFYN